MHCDPMRLLIVCENCPILSRQLSRCASTIAVFVVSGCTGGMSRNEWRVHVHNAGFRTRLVTTFSSTLCVEASILWPRVFRCHFSEECHIFHSHPGKLTMARFIRIDFRSTMWYRRNISGFSASSSRSNLLYTPLPSRLLIHHLSQTLLACVWGWSNVLCACPSSFWLVHSCIDLHAHICACTKIPTLTTNDNTCIKLVQRARRTSNEC